MGYESGSVWDLALESAMVWAYGSGSALAYGSALVYGSESAYGSVLVYGSELAYGSALAYGLELAYAGAGRFQFRLKEWDLALESAMVWAMESGSALASVWDWGTVWAYGSVLVYGSELA